MVDKISTEEDFNFFMQERITMKKWRDAIGFCKEQLHITGIDDRKLKQEERMNFERCLTENYLVKYGDDYFGKRDLLYVDLIGTADVEGWTKI